MNGDPMPEFSPYATASIVRRDGRTWITADPTALLHPTAAGQTFRIGDSTIEYHLERAERFGTSVMAWVDETSVVHLIAADCPILLEIVDVG
jgi:hypothetical protein